MEQKPIYVRDLLGNALYRQDETGVQRWDVKFLTAPRVQIVLDLHNITRDTHDDDVEQYMERMVSSMQVVPYITYGKDGEQHADAVLQLIVS